jgi:hypothetical protein
VLPASNAAQTIIREGRTKVMCGGVKVVGAHLVAVAKNMRSRSNRTSLKRTVGLLESWKRWVPVAVLNCFETTERFTGHHHMATRT